MNCGAICLQYVEKTHGRRISLRKARELCKTTRNGTRAADLIQALEQRGYKGVRLKQNIKWAELKRLVNGRNDVFLSWWSDLDTNGTPAFADGHWSVARKVTRDTITLFDPDPEQEVVLPKEFFVARWYDWEKTEHAARRDLIRAAVIARYK